MAETTYATLGELKERVLVAVDDAGADGLLQQVLNSAAELVDVHTRGFRAGCEAFSTSASETRVFEVDGTGFVAIDDAVLVNSVSMAGGGEVGWVVYPLQDAGAPVTPITGLVLMGGSVGERVEVLAEWGYCAAEERPAVVKEATLVLAAQMFGAIGQTGKAPGNGVVAGMLRGLVRRVYMV